MLFGQFGIWASIFFAFIFFSEGIHYGSVYADWWIKKVLVIGGMPFAILLASHQGVLEWSAGILWCVAYVLGFGVAKMWHH